tara:strand:- start:4587 stop:4961 length:375 start_codon:yes stop_codon:yes gene_type:complete
MSSDISGGVTEDGEFGFGPKLPPIENAKETIEAIVQQVGEMLGEGLGVNNYVNIKGDAALNLTVTSVAAEGDSPPFLQVSILDPQPRLNILGWIKSRLTGVKVSAEKIDIQIAKFPDLKIEVKS